MKSLICQVLVIVFLNIYSIDCGTCYKDQRKIIYQQLYNATRRVLDSVTPPLCYQIILNRTALEPLYISSSGIIGRVAPLGTFETTELAVEYLYGLVCPIPGLPPPTNVLQTIELQNVAYDKEYLRTHVEFIFRFTNGKRITFFVQIAFDKTYKICGYDGLMRNVGLTLDMNRPEEQKQSIASICAITQQICVGELQQYNSINECVEFLTTQVPFGSFDRADQGSVSCRLIHIRFVPIMPSIHCPHVGPTGGGKCTNKTIDYYYNQPNFLECAHRYSCSK